MWKEEGGLIKHTKTKKSSRVPQDTTQQKRTIQAQHLSTLNLREEVVQAGSLLP